MQDFTVIWGVAAETRVSPRGAGCQPATPRAGWQPAPRLCTITGAGLARFTHSETATMNLLTTFKGSMMEGFLPAGWDLEKIDRLAEHSGDAMVRRCKWWHADFQPVACASL